MIKGKIIEYKSLPELLQKLQNKKIVLTGGCFDIIHYGHYCLIKNAKKMGDILMIALESDEFIKNSKNKIAHHAQIERAEILAGFQDVDYVIKLPYFKEDQEYFKMIELIKPHVIAITEGDPLTEIKKEQAKKVGGQVKIACRQIKSLSSSNILNGKDFSRD